MVPIGIVAGVLGWNSTAVFTINFFAIIPLAAVLSFATEEISVKLGETMGGLLNATFGNAVELIVRRLFPSAIQKDSSANALHRSALLLLKMVRFKSCSPLCLALFSPTCCWLWVCASSSEALYTAERAARARSRSSPPPLHRLLAP